MKRFKLLQLSTNRLYLFGWVGLILLAGYFSYQGYRLFHNEPNVTQQKSHGPRFRSIPQTSSTSATQDLPAQQLPVPKLVPIVPTSSPQNGYGIAAGGGLTYVGQKELDAYFSQLKELGVGWVRWDIDWGFVQPDGPNTFKWQQIDLVANTAQKFGIKSLGIITYTPEWARKPACKNTDACSPADPKAFGVFAGQVATRYKGRIGAYEIWNEPNYSSFWAPTPNIDEYKQVLDSSHGQIKAVDPQALVIAGGLAAIGDEDGHISPLTFVQGLYARGAQSSFDAVAIHPYSYPAPPSYVAWWNRWQQIAAIHTVMSQAGDGAKQVWITEYGAPTGGPGKIHTTAMGQEYIYENDYMAEESQRALVNEAVQLHKQYTPWVGPFFWYSLQDNGQERTTPENFFGLLRYDGSKKPAYTTYQNLIKQ